VGVPRAIPETCEHAYDRAHRARQEKGCLRRVLESNPRKRALRTGRPIEGFEMGRQERIAEKEYVHAEIADKKTDSGPSKSTTKRSRYAHNLSMQSKDVAS
jgi:hypothetical protein